MIMKMVIKILRGVWVAVATLLLLLAVLFLFTSLSPIYHFSEPQPFSGPDIFNPYRGLDSAAVWHRANFHTHTRVEGMLNECKYWPREVLRRYEAFGYDIVGISNHNEITPHPEAIVPDSYEHGYNLRNFHKLLIGSQRVNHFDALYPINTSQLQWQLDMLRDDCELMQINHPVRTPMLTRGRLQRLAGYDIMELTGAVAYIENEYWDWALSAGHYSFGLLNDDLHNPDSTIMIASRCSFLALPTLSTEDILATLREGCFYSMRVPNYGSGDWQVKYERNRSLPAVRDIGLRGDTIYMTLTARADSIVVYGQNHCRLVLVDAADSVGYRLRAEDSYARIAAYLPDRVVIMSNPFARYDASVADRPGGRASHDINIPLTLLYNLALVLAVVVIVWLYLKYVIRWKRVR